MTDWVLIDEPAPHVKRITMNGSMRPHDVRIPGMLVDYITPHTYIVAEISYFEWASALVEYQRKNGANHG